MNPVIVYKGRLTTVEVSLEIDFSDDDEVPSSQIRSEPKATGTLLAEWTVTYATDGSDGELIMTIDDSPGEIVANEGYMDLKRVVGGNAVPVFEHIIPVLFRSSVTV